MLALVLVEGVGLETERRRLEGVRGELALLCDDCATCSGLKLETRAEEAEGGDEGDVREEEGGEEG